MMTPLVRAALVVTNLLSLAQATFVPVPALNAPVTTTVDGVSYTWKQLQGFTTLSAEAVDQFGDTIGGIGSAISVKRWKKNADGSYSGRMVAQPDKGHNTAGLVSFDARQHNFDFVFRPCTAADCTAANSLSMTYINSMKYIDTSPRNMNGGFTTGLDAVNVRPASGNFPAEPEATNGALSFDPESIAFAADGTFWMGDELDPPSTTSPPTIKVPDAILPHDANGVLNFQTSGFTNTYGRTANQGFEGLTISPDNKRLYALVQSALMQDSDQPNQVYTQNTRMLVYDISLPTSPSLLHQYYISLPTSTDLQTTWAGCELLYVNPTTFLLLARDGKGDGNGTSAKKLTSIFKNIGLITTTGATDVNGMYDAYNSAAAPNGVLNGAITPITFNEFVNIIDPAQLARFGVRSDTAMPYSDLITGKIESLALQPCLDPANPNDYFLFTVADNDFISTVEYQNGVLVAPDSYGYDVPTQFFVHRVTLPGAQVPSYLLDTSLNPSGLARRNRHKRDICGARREYCNLGAGRFECIDTSSNLEQCGGCHNAGGVDCSSLLGTVSVECIEGTCVADDCAKGFTLADGVCQ